MQRNVLKILALATIALGISHVEPRSRSIEATGGAAPLAQTTADLSPLKDNTLYESATGALSNGAGQHFFSGKTDSSALLRRGLITFDIAGSIPAGSTIESVTLTLNMSKTSSGTQTIELHRLLADWGEGSSDAPSNEGGGTSAATGDATWLHTFFNSALWASAGGDFSATVSASAAVGGIGSYTWSSAQMAADVQGWLDGPSTDFGWLVLGNEAVAKTTKRFDTKENATAANRPALSVQYTPPTFSIADATVGEGARVTTLTVTVDPTIGTPVSVDVATSNGSATAGQDFGTLGVSTQVTDTASFAANQATTTVTILIINDSMDELDETFTATLTNNSLGTAISSSAGSAAVSIVDDDPRPSLAAGGDVTVNEGVAGTTTTADILVTLSAESGLSISVDYATSDGTATVAGGDYVAVSGTLAIPAGDTTGTIQVTINGDVIDEFDETFVIALSGATTTGASLTISPATTTVTIVDDDPAPSLAILDQTASEADGKATVTVALTGASGGGVEVDVATSGGTAAEGVDYLSTSTRLVWAPDEGGDKSVTVSLIDDDGVEGDEFVLLGLSNASTTDPSAEGVVVGDDSAILNIIDDEAQQLRAIPAITEWGLFALSGLLGTAILWLRRRSPEAGRTGSRERA